MGSTIQPMNEVFSGARYTIGALVVVTLWSLGAIEYAEWRRDHAVVQAVAEQESYDEILLRVGPGSDPAEQLRYLELMDKTEQ